MTSSLCQTTLPPPELNKNFFLFNFLRLSPTRILRILTKRSSPFEPFFAAERGTSLCQFDRVVIAWAESVQFYLAAPLLRQTVAVIGWNGGVKRTLTFDNGSLYPVCFAMPKIGAYLIKLPQFPVSHVLYASKTHFEGHLRQVPFQSIT